MLEIPDINSVLVDDLRKPGNWVVANVQTNSYWPVKPQKVGYRGEDIWILPVMKGYFPSVAMSVPAGKSRDECSKLLMRFLSSLSWVERHGITVDGFTGGSLPRPLGREKTMGFSISDEFELEYLPEPVDERALLALALMREGRALNHPAYAFLSFYRVLEVALPNGKKRGPWIDDHIEVVTDPRAKEAIASLRAGGVADVGNHLYRTNRQAIAHATEAPIVDPDDPSHDRRLWSEMPIIAGLAELAIEKVLGVETSATVYAQHLYELAGFKEVFGPELREQIARGDRLGESTAVNIPQMDVRIRGREPYQPLLNMEPVQVGHQHGLVYLVLQSTDKRGRISFRLDFQAERLQFEVFDDLVYGDDGTAEAAEAVAEVKRFFRDYFGNGKLEIYNAETGALISRKDAFLPVNIRLDFDASAQDIMYWRGVAGLRRQRRASVGDELVQWADPYFLSIAVRFHFDQLSR